MLLLLLVVVAVVVSATPESAKRLRVNKERHHYVFVANNGEIDMWPIDRDIGVRLNCTHRRADMLRETLYYLDTDGDGCVDMPEMHTAFGLCLSWYERLGMRLGSIIGSIQTPETTMRDCDRNDDGRMCIEDVMKTNYECDGRTPVEHHCMCSCQPIDQMFDFILSREPC